MPATPSPPPPMPSDHTAPPTCYQATHLLTACLPTACLPTAPQLPARARQVFAFGLGTHGQLGLGSPPRGVGGAGAPNATVPTR
eukprot:987257-Prymnesium_polylepis.1